MMTLEIRRSREAVHEQDIRNIETILGVQLPVPYKNFLLSHNGGSPKPNRFPFRNSQLDGHGQIDFFLCIKDKDLYNLNTWIKRYKKRVPTDLIPIAVDPGGNLICLTIRGDNQGKLYFWDHEEEADESEQPSYKNIYLIANSFNELLSSLSG
jgi:hypothetical protein